MIRAKYPYAFIHKTLLEQDISAEKETKQSKKSKTEKNTTSDASHSTKKLSQLPIAKGKKMQHIPSDREINDAISNAIFDKNDNYISFSRYEDEKVVDYLIYSGIIHITEEKMSYDQKFLIDSEIGKGYITKYKTFSKRIELLIAEYPMIGAGAVGIVAAITSGTILWFINKILDAYVTIS